MDNIMHPIPTDLAVLSVSFLVLTWRFLQSKPSFCFGPTAGTTTRTKSLLDESRQNQALVTADYPVLSEAKMEVEQKEVELPSAGAAVAEKVDPERGLLERVLLDTFAVQSIKIGDQLGLYVALYEAQSTSSNGFASLQEICERAKTDSRLTYEWLQFQVKVQYISTTVSYNEEEFFRLEESMAKYLLPPAYSPVSMVGALRLATCMINLQPVIKSFETGQQTLFLPEESADVKFEEDLTQSKKIEDSIRYARETFCTRFFKYSFVEKVLLQVECGPDLVRKMDHGEIDVAEVFSGATSGLLCIALATQFRATRFIGFESSHVSLTRARDLAHAAETKNARFYDVKERSVQFGPPPSVSKKRVVKAGYGLVLTFMSMSMIDAEAQIALFKEVKAGLDPGALWIIMDLDAQDGDLTQAMSIGISMLHFLPSLPAPDTCSVFTERRCQQLARVAGFSSVTRGPLVTDEFLVKLNTFVLKA